jgi:hypothetical protein
MITAAVIAAPATSAAVWTGASGQQHTVHFPTGFATPAQTAAVAQLADGHAPQAATIPTTWHINGQAVTVQLPADHAQHLVYADSATVPVVQLAQAPAVAPAVDPALSVGATGVTNGTAALLLGGLIWYAVKHRGHRWGWMVVGVAMGTFIGSGSIGQMVHNTVGQLLASAINSIGGMS